jgi:Secretion system C-terminal sorting domain
MLGLISQIQLQGQACTGNTLMTMSIANPAYTATTYEFDVMVNNVSTVPVKFAGIQFGASMPGLPPGGGSLSVVVASNGPLGAGNGPGVGAALTYTAASFQMRTVGTPYLVEATAITIMPGLTLWKRIKVTTTIPWPANSSTTLTMNPYTASSTYTKNLVQNYCNGNPNVNALTDNPAGVAPGLTLGAALSVPLPIDLLDFSAEALVSSNLIKWVTAIERNSAWHIVERSKDGVNNWDQIGKVAGAGNSITLKHYSFEDAAPLSKSYYRLRSVDFDGQDERSSIVSVTRRSGIFGMTGVYPSPTSDLVNIQFEAMEEALVTLKVTDTNGRLVLEQQVSAIKGDNLTELSLGNLPVGTYAIQLISDDNASAQVMVVKQ